MKKEDLLRGDFLKQFKDSKEFGSFVDELYTRGVEQMLEGEVVTSNGQPGSGWQRHQCFEQLYKDAMIACSRSVTWTKT